MGTRTQEVKKDAPGLDGPWIVAGTSRSGKSTLIATINGSDSAIAGLPVEGLLPVYYYRKYLNPRRQLRRVVADYLLHSRRVDPSAGTSASPSEFYSSSLDELLAKFPGNMRHQLEAIDWALSRFAEERKRKTWAVCDVNPEMLFERFQKHIAGLKMVVMVRDPLESLAANLYWRSFPNRIPHSWSTLRQELLRWMMSVQVALQLRERYGDKVIILSFDGLIQGEREESLKAAHFLGANQKVYGRVAGGTPWFSRRGDGFLCPDGVHRNLLLNHEVALIRRATGELYRAIGFGRSTVEPGTLRAADVLFLLFARLILKFASIWPEGTKVVVDLILAPRRVAKRRLRILKAFLQDNLA